MENKMYISIPKQEYESREENYKTLKKEFNTFREECSKDSKYIVISEKYNILKHLNYRLKNNPFLGCSQEDYVKTYKGTTYENFLNELVIHLETRHSELVKNIASHINKNSDVTINNSDIKKESKLRRILKIIKE